MCIGDARKCVKHTTTRCTVDDTIHACKMDGFSPHPHPSSSFPPHTRIEPASASCIKKKELSVLAITCNYGLRAISKKCACNTKAKRTRRVRRREQTVCGSSHVAFAIPRDSQLFARNIIVYRYVNAQLTSHESDFPFRKGEQMCALLQFYDTRNGYASLFPLFPDPLG